MKKSRRGTYDREADCAYFKISPRIKRGEAVRQDVYGFKDRGDIVLDFDKKGRLLGVEVIGARSLLKPSTLKRATRIG